MGSRGMGVSGKRFSKVAARYVPSDELDGRKKRSSNQELDLDELNPRLVGRCMPNSDSNEDGPVGLGVSGCGIDRQRRCHYRKGLVDMVDGCLKVVREWARWQGLYR